MIRDSSTISMTVVLTYSPRQCIRPLAVPQSQSFPQGLRHYLIVDTLLQSPVSLQTPAFIGQCCHLHQCNSQQHYGGVIYSVTAGDITVESFTASQPETSWWSYVQWVTHSRRHYGGVMYNGSHTAGDIMVELCTTSQPAALRRSYLQRHSRRQYSGVVHTVTAGDIMVELCTMGHTQLATLWWSYVPCYSRQHYGGVIYSVTAGDITAESFTASQPVTIRRSRSFTASQLATLRWSRSFTASQPATLRRSRSFTASQPATLRRSRLQWPNVHDS